MVFYDKHAFACFGNRSISHPQKTCQLAPGVFTRRKDGAFAACEARALSAFSFGQGSFTPDFTRFQAHYCPGAFTVREAFTPMITVPVRTYYT